MHVCIKKIKKVSHPDEIQNIIIYYYIIFVRRRYYIYLLSIRKLFGIAASTLFGKCLTVKNVRCTWYRLSNITVYSFLTLMTFLFFYNSKILVKTFIHSPIPRVLIFFYFVNHGLAFPLSPNPRVRFSHWFQGKHGC